MNVTGWEPPKNAFDREVAKPSSSREVKLSAYRQDLALKAIQEKESGIHFAEEKEAYDAMGVSTAWQKSEKREDDKTRKQRLLEEWKARDERQKPRRGGEYSQPLDDKSGTRDRAPNRALQVSKTQARGVRNTHSAQARMGIERSTGSTNQGMNFTAGMDRGAAVTMSSRRPGRSVSGHRDGQERGR